jgi:hypothetical protein
MCHVLNTTSSFAVTDPVLHALQLVVTLFFIHVVNLIDLHFYLLGIWVEECFPCRRLFQISCLSTLTSHLSRNLSLRRAFKEIFLVKIVFCVKSVTDSCQNYLPRTNDCVYTAYVIRSLIKFKLECR